MVFVLIPTTNDNTNSKTPSRKWVLGSERRRGAAASKFPQKASDKEGLIHHISFYVNHHNRVMEFDAHLNVTDIVTSSDSKARVSQEEIS
jgi:hypothetical protein